MSIHISANKDEVAPKILLPGDPLRAKYIAEKYLEDVICFNKTRGMYGFTGLFNGEKVSVMGSGMGQASLSIYVTELIEYYGVKELIRVGSCGSYQLNIGLRDIILANGASTDSAVNSRVFKGMDYAATANFELLNKAFVKAQEKSIPVKVGNILSSDSFYNYDQEEWKLWANFNILAVEMESNALYTIAALKRVKALSILTVSDSLVTGEMTSSEEREKTFNNMIELALEI